MMPAKDNLTDFGKLSWGTLGVLPLGSLTKRELELCIFKAAI
tara:strand:+ start:160 stop:285 length:126 start_codon:yes stop_codon:yes gene_type:complete